MYLMVCYNQLQFTLSVLYDLDRSASFKLSISVLFKDCCDLELIVVDGNPGLHAFPLPPNGLLTCKIHDYR